MSGWIRITRESFDHPLLNGGEMTRREAWFWLIQKAAWRDGKLSVETTGEALRVAWKWKRRDAVGRLLRKFQASGLVDIDVSKASIAIRLNGHGELFEVFDSGGAGKTGLLGRGQNPMPPFRAAPSGWQKTRLRVFARDGFRCSYCRTEIGPFECDHIYPVVLGGSDEDCNLTTAYKPCNASKSKKTIEEWVR